MSSSNSSDEDDIYDIYNTKNVCSLYKQFEEEFRKGAKKNQIDADKKSEVETTKPNSLIKNGIHKKTSGIKITAKEINSKNTVEQPSSDTDDSVVSLGALECEDNATAKDIAHVNVNVNEPCNNTTVMQHINNEGPPARSTRSQNKNFIMPIESSSRNSPQRKKKRGPIDKYLSSKTKVLNKKEEEVISIEDEDENATNKEEEEELNYEVCVKIIWKSSKVRKFTLRKFQKFSKIFEQFMKEENVSADKVILTFKGQKVKPTDTPDSLNLQVYEFIDGGILSEVSNNLNNSNAEENEADDSNMILLRFQDKNKQIVNLKLSKRDKMKVIMLKYSEQIEVPLDKIKFLFDGEVLDPSETPTSLGLENEEIIDVKF